MNDLRQALVRSLAEECGPVRALRFDPNAHAYSAYRLGGQTELRGALEASTLEQAQAEASDRWHWDRGDRIGIREQGQEDSKLWPFEKQPFDRLHVYAVQRSKPLRWELAPDGFRSVPVYRYSLKLLTIIDLKVIA
jgi:hypothetical protein